MSALLAVDGLRKAYRGVHAVRDGVSFEVKPGSITGLIGPNGSGKSTTIDCITGFQRADAGRVVLGGIDITGRAPQQIARAGMMRTFQTVRVYDDFDLLRQPARRDARRSPRRPGSTRSCAERAFAARRSKPRRGRARLIELVGLTRLIHAPAGILSYGQKKLLAIAAAMMADPKLVVLDEPVAGVNPTPRERDRRAVAQAQPERARHS